MTADWLGRPYYSLDAFLKNTYGEKYYKIALDGGFSCPNRDGTAGRGGCIFCSEGGSGDFAVRVRQEGSLCPDTKTVMEARLQEGFRLFGRKKTGSRFIAYFQAYTGTYAPVSYLRTLYTAALELPQTAGISIATRPDCLPEEVLALLTELKAAYPDKFIWLELGLQTMHERTAAFCNRGYSLPVFREAVKALAERSVPVIVHVILGLPGETPEMMYDTCRCLNGLPVSGIKLQLLHILKNTPLGNAFLRGELGDFTVLSQEEYLDILIHCLEILRPDMVIHRLTGDGPRELTIAPLWSLHKRNVLNTLHQEIRRRSTFQGRCYHDEGTLHSV